MVKDLFSLYSLHVYEEKTWRLMIWFVANDIYSFREQSSSQPESLQASVLLMTMHSPLMADIPSGQKMSLAPNSCCHRQIKTHLLNCRCWSVHFKANGEIKSKEQGRVIENSCPLLNSKQPPPPPPLLLHLHVLFEIQRLARATLVTAQSLKQVAPPQVPPPLLPGLIKKQKVWWHVPARPPHRLRHLLRISPVLRVKPRQHRHSPSRHYLPGQADDSETEAWHWGFELVATASAPSPCFSLGPEQSHWPVRHLCSSDTWNLMLQTFGRATRPFNPD